jgi:hypothetical protein
MHRIRLHAQWKRDTSNLKVSRFSRAFHSPTGLTPTDKVFLTASISPSPDFDLTEIIIRLNQITLQPQLANNTLSVEITPHLIPYNQIQLDMGVPSTIQSNSTSLWPLENLALEIHAAPQTD